MNEYEQKMILCGLPHTLAVLWQGRSTVLDIKNGVRVNVAPLQKVRLLSADMIVKKDLEKAVSDRVEWHSNERQWW